jgi:DNA-binding YbaB/EbfC family protein
MQLRGGMSELMRQAARMQRKIEARKAELKDQEVTHKTANDKVGVTVSCEGKVRRIEVDPEFLKEEGLEMSLDAIVAATNAALEEADKIVDDEINKITGGIKIPGM